MGETPQPGDDTERSGRILDGLRAFGANYTEFTDRFAAWLGLHSTDATALVEILYAEDKGTPLSPTRLSERLALTTGATTNLLNRLERLGHIVRTREQADRRAVTLRSSKEIEAPAREFFAPLAVHLDALVAQYPREQLDQFEKFLEHLRISMNKLLAEQDDAPASPPPK